MTLEALLSAHELSAYTVAFQRARVRVEDLASLSEDDLIDDFGMASYGDRKRFKALVASLSGGAAARSGVTRMGVATPTPALGGVTPSLSGATRASGPPGQVGSYRVLGVLGAGGMGTVLRARHVEEGWASQQGGDVAVKLVHPEIASSGEFRARFLTEAGLGRRLSHPGLVPVYDVVVEGGHLAMVMGLVEGLPLSAKIRPGGMSLEEALGLLGPVGEVLDYLHGAGVVHRDIKPGNIVIRGAGRPVVLDLGIAKAGSMAGGGHTRTATSLGTGAWMAPEQVDAKHIDGAADRYAFGLLAYALLSGRLPWGSEETEARVLVTKLTGRLEGLSVARPGIALGVSEAVMRMLEVEPARRYGRCGEFVSALRENSAQSLRREAEALVKEAASCGIGLRLPEVLSPEWLRSARVKVEEMRSEQAASAARLPVFP